MKCQVFADVNDATNGATPLYVAAGQNHTTVVTALLAAGADVNKAHYNGATPLVGKDYKRQKLSIRNGEKNEEREGKPKCFD